ncbi:MAG: hypothetical protein U0132_23825 [Gemmatimonadaceae bacterium]
MLWIEAAQGVVFGVLWLLGRLPFYQSHKEPDPALIVIGWVIGAFVSAVAIALAAYPDRWLTPNQRESPSLYASTRSQIRASCLLRASAVAAGFVLILGPSALVLWMLVCIASVAFFCGSARAYVRVDSRTIPEESGQPAQAIVTTGDNALVGRMAKAGYSISGVLSLLILIVRYPDALFQFPRNPEARDVCGLAGLLLLAQLILLALAEAYARHHRRPAMLRHGASEPTELRAQYPVQLALVGLAYLLMIPLIAILVLPRPVVIQFIGVHEHGVLIFGAMTVVFLLGVIFMPWSRIAGRREAGAK